MTVLKQILLDKNRMHLIRLTSCHGTNSVSANCQTDSIVTFFAIK